MRLAVSSHLLTMYVLDDIRLLAPDSVMKTQSLCGNSMKVENNCRVQICAFCLSALYARAKLYAEAITASKCSSQTQYSTCFLSLWTVIEITKGCPKSMVERY